MGDLVAARRGHWSAARQGLDWVATKAGKVAALWAYRGAGMTADLKVSMMVSTTAAAEVVKMVACLVEMWAVSSADPKAVPMAAW